MEHDKDNHQACCLLISTARNVHYLIRFKLMSLLVQINFYFGENIYFSLKIIPQVVE